jgi:putative sigma-54 modulation protein
MEFNIRGKNVKISDDRKKLIESKLGKLDHYLEFANEAVVELTATNAHKQTERMVVEMTVRVNGTVLRAEEHDSELATALDRVHDKMRRQMTRYKERLTSHKGQPKLTEAVESIAIEEPAEAVEEISLVKVKRFAVTPMNAEEAIEELENVGHDFYMFLDSESKQVNVVYRRKEGGYGLLKPEI